MDGEPSKIDVGGISINKDLENIKKAKNSFEHILSNKKYADIIRDDNHLSILLNLLQDGKYSKILDIGTGTGYLAFPLSEIFSSATVYGIDIAENIVAKNNEIVKRIGISNLIFKVFDGLRYPFPNGSFDLIVTRYVFHHFPDAADAISQMYMLLVKGGKVLVSDPIRNEQDNKGIINNFMRIKNDGHIQFYSSRELDEIFTDNGFVKENQVITDMKFPFPQSEKYIELYKATSDTDKQLYNITNENGVVWVKYISVGNTIFVKQ